MNDIKHKLLMINGSKEEIQEGEGRHPCYRMYRHDMPFTEGKNVWVQFDWDKSAKYCFRIIVCCNCSLTTTESDLNIIF